MSFALIDAEKAHHPIDALCRNLGVSRSEDCAWKRRTASARSRADLTRADRIAAIHERSRGA